MIIHVLFCTGHMGSQTALSTGSPSGALYYPPVFVGPADYAGNYYPQVTHLVASAMPV